MNRSRAVILAGLLGLSGVAAGAFGAHGLRESLDARSLELWATAARYQQIHAVALLVVGLVGGAWTRARSLAALLFTIGVLVFSGTVYGLALGGPGLLGAITPLGGLCLIAGWASIGWHGVGLARANAAEPPP